MRKSPTSASGLRRCASASGDLRRLVLDRVDDLAEAQQRGSRRLRGRSRRGCRAPGRTSTRPAFWMACSIASSTSSRVDALLAGDRVGDLQHLEARDIGGRVLFLFRGLGGRGAWSHLSPSLRAAARSISSVSTSCALAMFAKAIATSRGSAPSSTIARVTALSSARAMRALEAALPFLGLAGLDARTDPAKRT